MKIGIDISQIIYGTGVSVYTKNIVESLLKIDKNDEFTLFGTSLRRGGEILNLFPQAKVFPFPPTLMDFIWNRLHIFPVEKLIGDIDVFHSSDWVEPPSRAFKVTTVHDLYPFRFPKLVSPKILDVHKRKMGWVLKESDRIITPSESTKKDLVGLGADPAKIRVVAEAASIRKASEEEVERVRRKYDLHDDYLVSIGITKLKNTKRIIEAFHLSKAGKGLKLLLVGRPNGVIVEHERDIRILGHVPQNDLAALLTGSRGLIFASLYEGFGLPILDAFACEVPVVASEVASMPEVAGDAAALVDPESVGSIADGIGKILRGRIGFVEKGSRRLKAFSWERAATETLSVYKEALK